MAMDLHLLFDTYVELKMTPVDEAFSFDRGFSYHFVAPHHPPPSTISPHPPPTPHSTTIGVVLVLAMPVKKPSKMMGNLASYPFNSLYINRLWIAKEWWQIAHKHLFSFPWYNTSNKVHGITKYFLIVHGSQLFSQLTVYIFWWRAKPSSRSLKQGHSPQKI